ncbi:MAG: alpha/beta hydrolase family protein [Planctomycetota bacterium]
MAGKKTLYLSPSEYHQYLMAATTPLMKYCSGDVKAWQKRFREKLRQLAGFVPKHRVPLNVRSIWKHDHRLGSIEKVAFCSELFSDIVAYVCLPKKTEVPYRFMICLQGHTTGMHFSIAVQRENETKPMRVPGDRDFAIGCMRRGFAALCIEQRSFGFRREQIQKAISPHGCHDAVMHALMLGRTLVGERVFDVDRGIDYLQARGDADMAQIGVMGNSGGGTVSIYASALLSRVKFAMPSCAFSTFRDSIMSIYHCADNYIPGLYNYADMGDVLGLFAPKPVVVVAGVKDPIFPISGVRRAFRQLKNIYRAAGAADKCKLVVGPGGHRFYAKQGWEALLKRIDS